MEWRDDAIVLGTRRHGESSLVLEVMTRERGRCLGLVKGGRSPRFAAKLQPGNGLDVTWRARLDEHLGNFTVEPTELRASRLMETALGLNVVQTLASHLRLLPERDPHPELFEALSLVLDHAGEPIVAGGLTVRFELMILDALGFGLDLDTCALTGVSDDLAFVSPRTGRAASRTAGHPWRDRLLALPPFLIDATSHEAPLPLDILAGFQLTAHFLQSHVWGPRGLQPPMTRAGLLAAIIVPADI
jgi:DNA repair protein RecO (recombination protein O)